MKGNTRYYFNVPASPTRIEGVGVNKAVPKDNIHIWAPPSYRGGSFTYEIIEGLNPLFLNNLSDGLKPIIIPDSDAPRDKSRGLNPKPNLWETL